MINELFTAIRGQGARLNGYRLRLKNTNELEDAIIAINFPFNIKQHTIFYIKIISKLFKKCTDFRCMGSTTLSLAYVAAGRIDAFFEIGLKPNKFIAGDLLVRESGGIITDFVGGYNYFSSGNLLAGSSRILKNIVLEIQIELNNLLKHQ